MKQMPKIYHNNIGAGAYLVMYTEHKGTVALLCDEEGAISVYEKWRSDLVTEPKFWLLDDDTLDVIPAVVETKLRLVPASQGTAITDTELSVNEEPDEDEEAVSDDDEDYDITKCVEMREEERGYCKGAIKELVLKVNLFDAQVGSKVKMCVAHARQAVMHREAKLT